MRRYHAEWLAIPEGSSLLAFLNHALNVAPRKGWRLHSWQVAPALTGPGVVLLWETEEVLG